MRQEVVSAAKNYLIQRLALEQDAFVNRCTSFLQAATLSEFLKDGVEIMKAVFPNEVQQFCNEVCDSWPAIENVGFLPETADCGAQLSVRLRKLLPLTQGSLRKCLASIFVLAPHSMQTERMVSVHNKIVTADRSNLKDTSVNARMLVALNGMGTAYWDPREAVAEFLKKKERRQKYPETEVYSQRKFVSKFFRKN